MAPRRIRESSEESKRRILDAAEELFLELGYEKTTLSAVGQRCGISYGSIPWHFGNKAGLLYSVVNRFVEQFVKPDKVYPPGTAGLNMLMTEISAWDNDPRLPLLHMLEGAVNDAPAEMVQSLVDRDQTRIERISRWISATLAMQQSPKNIDAYAVAHVFVAAVRGIAVMDLVERRNFELAGARAALRTTMEILLGLDE